MRKTRFRYMPTIRWGFYLCFLALAFPSMAKDVEESLPETRIWTSRSGKQVEAAFERLSYDSIRVRTPAGDPIVLPFDALSDVDMKYIRMAVVPEIALDVKKKQNEGPKCKVQATGNGRSAADETMIVTLSVDVAKTSRFPFDGTLLAEIFMVGDELNSEEHRLVAVQTLPVRFTEENEGRCQLSVSAGFQKYLEYNMEEMRGCVYAGYVIAISDSSGKLVAFETNLSWMSDTKLNDLRQMAFTGEESKLDRLRKFHVFTFFDDNCKKRSVPRPKYYTGRF